MATKSERSGFIIAGLLLFGIGNVILKYQRASEENKEYSFEDGLGDFFKGCLLGAPVGLIASEMLGSPNDTVNYKQYHKGKIVYTGIAYEHRKDAREIEHKADGKIFSKMTFDEPKPRVEAMELEKKLIKQHKPKYNIHHNR